MPALLAAAKSSKDGKARVITTSSAGHYLTRLHWDTLVDGPARRSLNTSDLYNQSKNVRYLTPHSAPSSP